MTKIVYSVTEEHIHTLVEISRGNLSEITEGRALFLKSVCSEVFPWLRLHVKPLSEKSTGYAEVFPLRYYHVPFRRLLSNGVWTSSDVSVWAIDIEQVKDSIRAQVGTHVGSDAIDDPGPKVVEIVFQDGAGEVKR
jgi:hypothetical protein